MARGFIRSPLDVRLLILYILDRLILPVTMAELTELALCDEGMDYFQFADALSALTTNGHVAQSEDDRIFITDKGRSNCAICETELPYSVRTKCDRNTQVLNRILQRKDQVRAVVTPVPNRERYTVEMTLDDDAGNLMTLRMTAPDHLQADLLAEHFQERAEQVYHAVLASLLDEHQKG